MNRSLILALACLTISITAIPTQAALVVKVNEPRTYGQKAIIKLELQNTFANKIESARAVVFLSDDKGKVVGQETRWIIGGTKDRPALEPNGKTTFNFVVASGKPFTKTKVTVTRLILEHGAVADVNRQVTIDTAVK